jgi:Zn-dependent M28 family amino/carboxypeptidase
MPALLLILIAALAAAQPHSVEYKTLEPEVLQKKLRLAHRNPAERLKRLKDLFAESGCTAEVRQEQKVRGSGEPNIICGLAGQGDDARTIIVGAHFDSVGGDGVIDNWSGAVLLPILYKFMSGADRRHAFRFIAFAAEEKGLLDSRAYVKSLPKPDRDQIAAVLILDSLGMTPTKCWVNGSSRDLVDLAARLADALKLELKGLNVEQVGTTDSQPFKDAGIPVLCLHSVTQEKWKTINGKRDVWSAVSWNDYYDTHRLVSAMVQYFDGILP